MTAAARREAFDLAITAAHQRATRQGITPAAAALELLQTKSDTGDYAQVAAYAAVHGYLQAQENKA